MQEISCKEHSLMNFHYQSILNLFVRSQDNGQLLFEWTVLEIPFGTILGL